MTLGFNQHRLHVNRLIEAALGAADPYQAVRRQLFNEPRGIRVGDRSFDLGEGRVFLVSVGKASQAMAAAAADILGARIHAGVVIAKAAPAGMETALALPANVALWQGAHPVPDERSVRATEAALALLADTRPDDLVLSLISGGASALFTRPRLPLDDWQALVEALLASGCSIDELNAVRRPLDEVKGGGLARAAAPAPCVALILSDVVGNRLDVIGSGPTVADPGGPAAAAEVMRRYKIASVIGPGPWHRVEEALEAAGRPVPFPEPTNLIVGDVRRSAEAAAQAAQDMGFEVILLTTHLEGEAREVGRVVAALAKDALRGQCLILGGETTVTLRGDGHGGRNQELALSAAVGLAGKPGVVVASFATDGEDGPTDAAGAIASGETATRAARQGLDLQAFLDRNDSYHLFAALDTLIVTGPSGTNVNDLVFILNYAI